jgi:small subunit ribosomal protein S30e
MGKVHGSLARAGKVKNQTPKVEKQEDKKKLPRGRAKKRLQYNRRYVNVVSGMGGKRVGVSWALSYTFCILYFPRNFAFSQFLDNLFFSLIYSPTQMLTETNQ